MSKFTFTVQRFGDDGWFFAKCDQMPGVMLFAPTEAELDAQAAPALKLMVQSTAQGMVNRLTTSKLVEQSWQEVKRINLQAAA